MSKTYREDLLPSQIDKYSVISLKSNKIAVLVIGGGRAGYIKAKAFSQRGSKVFVLAKSFFSSFKELEELPNIFFIEDNYKKEYIVDKHLIVIATNDDALNEIIRIHCDSLYKIYIDSASSRNGIAFNSCQRETKNLVFGLNNKISCPRVTVFLADKIKKELLKYDAFVGYVTTLRAKILKEEKKEEIMNFVCSDDFYYFFSKGYEEYILEIFYGGNYGNTENCHSQK